MDKNDKGRKEGKGGGRERDTHTERERDSKGERASVSQEGKKKTEVTYHDWQHRVDFPVVVLILVEDVDGYTRLLTAETAHAARLEGLHTAVVSLSLRSLASEARYVALSPRAARRRTRASSLALFCSSFLRSYMRLALVCIRTLLRRSQKVRSM